MEYQQINIPQTSLTEKSEKIQSLLRLHPMVAAPMAGVTDVPFRRIVRSFGPQLIYSEMVEAECLLCHTQRELKRLGNLQEFFPMVVQLLGRKKEQMARAAQILEQEGAFALDINMGCPAQKVLRSQKGAALLKETGTAMELTEAVASQVAIPVGVKIRNGWSEKWNETNGFDIGEFAFHLQQSGASFLAVHGRTAQNGYAGKADWNCVKRVKQAVDVPVIGNGDVLSFQEAFDKQSLSGCTGVMIGRGLLGRPWLLSVMEEKNASKKEGDFAPPPEFSSLAQVILAHFREMMAFYGVPHGIFVARKHLCWYAEGKSGAKEFKSMILKQTDASVMEQMITDFFENEK